MGFRFKSCWVKGLRVLGFRLGAAAILQQSILGVILRAICNYMMSINQLLRSAQTLNPEA